MQELPYRQMHWFEPFGSVKFEDLHCAPIGKFKNGERAIRYLFWDQEPLQKYLIDETLSKFQEIYNDKCRIITSERDSEMVEYVENTYGIQSHYYFFHGWAALDWFRGYDHSFLMPEPQERKIRTTFISPNRIVGGERIHRFIMFYYMCKNNLLFNHISFPESCPEERVNLTNLIQAIAPMYPDVYDVFYQNNTLKFKFPLTFEGEDSVPMDSCRLSLFKPAAESMLYLVTETLAKGRRQHLTEKTFKPICLRMPFILVGTQGALKYLRSYGFKTFGDFWDESYDDEPNDFKRLEMITQVLCKLDRLPIAQKQQLFNSANEVIEHNYQHFYKGGFKDILWQELNLMINEF
jgi:hypothetical protein